MPRSAKHVINTGLYSAGRILLGAVFIWASWGKILDPAAFALAIDNYHIVPAAMSSPVALVLPWVELVCGGCLILNRWTRGSAFLTALLMLVFMGAIGFNIFRGMDINCGCFTLDESAPGNMWLDLVRDIVLLIVAVGVMCRPPTQATAPRRLGI